jgi:NADH dehydrogenase (ubiquinone) flavoprotein 2
MSTLSPRTADKKFIFNRENQAKFEAILTQYPKGKEASGVLPTLNLAQQQNGGWLSPSALEYVAEILGMPLPKVWEVAHFYTLFNTKPVGKYLVQVCGTTPCWLRGSQDIMKSCQKWLGIQEGETTSDKAFTLKEVECLGACTTGPVVQINEDYYEDLTPQKITGILEALAEGKKVIKQP